MEIFDTHAHFGQDGAETAAVLARAAAAGVTRLVAVGGSEELNAAAIQAQDTRPDAVRLAIGADRDQVLLPADEVMSEIRHLHASRRCAAVGEIGLDFHYDLSPREEQRDCFRRQIRMANELKMPIVIHSREADGETMDILKEEGAFSEERKSWFAERPVPAGWESAAKDARVLLHCYSGSRELGEQYVRLGGTLSMCGPLTYKNARKTVEVAEAIPLEFLLVETDSPFLTPVPLRGKPNRSSYVVHTARRLAMIKGMELEDVAEQTCINAMRFFGITE